MSAQQGASSAATANGSSAATPQELIDLSGSNGFKGVASPTSGTAAPVLSAEVLAEIDALVEKCAPGAIEEDPEFAALIDTQLEQTDENPLEVEYRGFQIKIEEEKVGKLTRRFAVAINSRGERSVVGDKSFSATTKVLIDEAKFEVDKLLQ